MATTEPSNFLMGLLRINPYSHLAADDMDASQSTQLKPKFSDILRSKRVRILAAASFITLVLLFIFYGPRQNLSSFDWNRCPSPETVSSSPPGSADVDWSRYAYTQYVTNTAYLCNSVMLFEILHRLGSKADRVMMYPSSMHLDSASTSVESKLLLKAQKEYGVKLLPIEVQHRAGGDQADPATWADSFTKLLAFNQTQYDRVLSLDSDSTVLQHMDELFLLPPCPVAMPRAYWLRKDKPNFLSSQLVLIQPSVPEFKRIDEAIKNAKGGDFDMEIVNDLYGTDSMILPHRKYDLLTGEFRSDTHENYLGNNYEEWDPETMLKEAKFLHFSDWPVPKPWLTSAGVAQSKQPKCFEVNGKEDCRAREMWNGFYSDFRERRKNVCNIIVNKRSEEEEVSKRGAWEFEPTLV